MIGHDRLTLLEGIVIVIAFVFSGTVGLLFLCFTDWTVYRMASWRWKLHKAMWDSSEDFPTKQKDHLLRTVQHPEEASFFIKGSLRVAGCGLLAFCIVLLILGVLTVLTNRPW